LQARSPEHGQTIQNGGFPPILFNYFLGPLSTDLFASKLSSQLLVFVSWRPDPLAVGTDAGLEYLSREVVCHSPLQSDRQIPVSITNPRSSGASISSTSLESPSLISIAPPNVGKSTNSHSTVSRHNTASESEQSIGHHTTVSSMGFICQQCECSHLSQTATNLLLSSWRDKSNKSHNSSFSKWASWCGKQNRNPFSGSLSDVANFLADLYDQSYKYAYCSAISSTHDKVDDQPVGQHPENTQGSLQPKAPFTQILFYLGSVNSHLVHCCLR